MWWLQMMSPTQDGSTPVSQKRTFLKWKLIIHLNFKWMSDCKSWSKLNLCHTHHIKLPADATVCLVIRPVSNRYATASVCWGSLSQHQQSWSIATQQEKQQGVLALRISRQSRACQSGASRLWLGQECGDASHRTNRSTHTVLNATKLTVVRCCITAADASIPGNAAAAF